MLKLGSCWSLEGSKLKCATSQGAGERGSSLRLMSHPLKAGVGSKTSTKCKVSTTSELHLGNTLRFSTTSLSRWRENTLRISKTRLSMQSLESQWPHLTLLAIPIFLMILLEAPTTLHCCPGTSATSPSGCTETDTQWTSNSEASASTSTEGVQQPQQETETEKEVTVTPRFNFHSKKPAKPKKASQYQRQNASHINESTAINVEDPSSILGTSHCF